MTTADKWKIAIEMVAAVAVLILAVLAIWGDWVRSILAAPKLKVSLRSEEGVPTSSQDGSPVRYYHLVVSNSRRWAPARNAIPYIRMVERPGPDGQWRPAMFTGPVTLWWQFGKHTPGLPMIGQERICDLARIVQGKNFELVPMFRPNSLDATLEPSMKMRVHVFVNADSGESPDTVIEIAWDGNWVDGAQEMRRHLVLKEVTPTS